LARKGLLVIGDIGGLVVGSANAVVREEVRVTGVSTGGGALVRAKLRAGVKLSAAEGLAKGWCERVGVDGDSRVSALGGNEAREGRSGEDNGGVEHGDDDVWRWRSGWLWRGSGVSMAEAQQDVADGSGVKME
jgi:hypothetical protein